MTSRFICNAGAGCLTVDPNGYLYPCHRFVDNKDYYLGEVSSEIDFKPCEPFLNLDHETIPGCSNCWARKFCLGTCPGASVAAGFPPGHPCSEHHCAEKKLYALISLKCAVAEGRGLY